ncbi:sarcosine oxidase subunit gamma [Aliiroseovarius sp. YM-037]|uniref:sarcosine oxidase subunit gamma n=1 Tax=Aliiroseovarius sp. YM-037 TaxID=3341728 RepID=UPI003A80177D
MSNVVSALNHQSYQGFATVEELGLRGMITLRGDLASAAVKKAATGVTGVDMPGQREISWADEKGIAWMSPDELLVIVPYDDVNKSLGAMEKTLKGKHALAANVSDARVAIRIAGPGAREVLAKVCPVDLSTENFGAGEIRRTRLAQVPAAFWMSGEDEFTLVAFRSVATYVFDVLSTAASPGSEVNYL